MIIALWIIAICELIRLAQNCIQLYMSANYNRKYMKTATDEFVKSLKRTDTEFVAGLLKKIEESEDKQQWTRN